jgi:hypothetical protein
MKRRGCNLGCIVALLGLVLSCCLLPHLLSSIYSLVTAVLPIEAASNWLWGDWLSTLPVIGDSEALYMIFAEGPICCAGTLALLVLMLGVVAMIASLGQEEEYYDEENPDAYQEPQ